MNKQSELNRKAGENDGNLRTIELDMVYLSKMMKQHGVLL